MTDDCMRPLPLLLLLCSVTTAVASSLCYDRTPECWEMWRDELVVRRQPLPSHSRNTSAISRLCARSVHVTKHDRIVFLRVPKTGSTSLKLFFRCFLSAEWSVCPREGVKNPCAFTLGLADRTTLKSFDGCCDQTADCWHQSLSELAASLNQSLPFPPRLPSPSPSTLQDLAGRRLVEGKNEGSETGFFTKVFYSLKQFLLPEFRRPSSSFSLPSSRENRARVFLIGLFRDPIDRLISEFYYIRSHLQWRRQGLSSDLFDAIVNGDLSRFLTDERNPAHNIYAHMLGMDDLIDALDVTEEDIVTKEVRSKMASFHFVGLTSELGNIFVFEIISSFFLHLILWDCALTSLFDQYRLVSPLFKSFFLLFKGNHSLQRGSRISTCFRATCWPSRSESQGRPLRRYISQGARAQCA
jgi:hypothetical protein